MCFLPKSRASRDQAPGPIMANAAPKTASMMGTVRGYPRPERGVRKRRRSTR